MLTLTYVTLAVAGCGYVAFAFLMGQGFDGDGGDADGGFHFPLFSPLSLATFLGATGALGLLATHGLHLSNPASVAVALIGSLLFTYVASYAAWRVLVSSTGTQTVRERDLLGATAEVLTPIPEGGLGEVVALVRGQRHTAPARTADGAALSRGAIVIVERVAGVTLIVRPDVAAVRTS
ncbi:MAG TPA: NfeD family protein [Luteitalea sp.]|nr:NfeD family protein [Luteitalea sp.]